MAFSSDDELKLQIVGKQSHKISVQKVNSEMKSKKMFIPLACLLGIGLSYKLYWLVSEFVRSLFHHKKVAKNVLVTFDSRGHLNG